MTSDSTEMYDETQDNINEEIAEKINEARKQTNSVKELSARSKDDILNNLESGPISVPDTGRQTARDVAKDAILTILGRYPEVWLRPQQLFALASERDANGHVTTPILSTGKAFCDLLWNMGEEGDKVLRRGRRIGAKKAGFYSLASGQLWDASIGRNETKQVITFVNYDEIVAKRFAEIENAEKMIAKLQKQKPKTETAKETRDLQIAQFRKKIVDAKYGERPLERVVAEKRSNA